MEPLPQTLQEETVTTQYLGLLPLLEGVVAVEGKAQAGQMVRTAVLVVAAAGKTELKGLAGRVTRQRNLHPKEMMEEMEQTLQIMDQVVVEVLVELVRLEQEPQAETAVLEHHRILLAQALTGLVAAVVAPHFLAQQLLALHLMVAVQVGHLEIMEV